MPLQNVPGLGLQGSMLSQPKKSRSRGVLSQGLDTECTPTDHILQLSPPPNKHQRLMCKGKENDSNQFVLGRRSRRRKESLSGRRKRSLNLKLKIFSCN